MAVQAQVDVKLEFAQDKFLTGETSEVTLRIANFTGGPLRLGERAARWSSGGPSWRKPVPLP